MVCQGCWEGLPKLDPEMDLSAVQLVSPKTTKEEILSLYLEVYKQQRLPGLPPREPELTDEAVSSFKGCQGWKKEKTPGVTVRPQSFNAQPLKSRVTEKRETSIEKSLAPIREAHQKLLAVTAALKGEIERLSCPVPQSWPEVRVMLKSRDHQMPQSARGGITRCDSPTTLLPATHLKKVQSLVRGRQLLMTWSWGNCQSWSWGYLLPQRISREFRGRGTSS